MKRVILINDNHHTNGHLNSAEQADLLHHTTFDSNVATIDEYIFRTDETAVTFIDRLPKDFGLQTADQSSLWRAHLTDVPLQPSTLTVLPPNNTRAILTALANSSELSPDTQVALARVTGGNATIALTTTYPDANPITVHYNAENFHQAVITHVRNQRDRIIRSTEYLVYEGNHRIFIGHERLISDLLPDISPDIRAIMRAFSLQHPEVQQVAKEDPNPTRWIRFYWDRHYWGGPKDHLGTSILVPVELCERIGHENAFRAHTQINQRHITGYNSGDILDASGQPLH